MLNITREQVDDVVAVYRHARAHLKLHVFGVLGPTCCPCIPATIYRLWAWGALVMGFTHTKSVRRYPSVIQVSMQSLE